MNRLLLIGSLACLLVASTGCQMGGCGAGSCSSGACSQSCGECGDCGDCGGGCSGCGPVGVIGKLKAMKCCGGGHCGGNCGNCGDNGGGNCGRGMLGKLCGRCGGGCGSAGCGDCGGRAGCRAGALGWQSGGLDYSSHLQAGLIGHKAPAALNNRPFTPGPPSAQVGYPYYSHRGPRDFFIDNPPTIGR